MVLEKGQKAWQRQKFLEADPTGLYPYRWLDRMLASDLSSVLDQDVIQRIVDNDLLLTYVTSKVPLIEPKELVLQAIIKLSNV